MCPLSVCPLTLRKIAPKNPQCHLIHTLHCMPATLYPRWTQPVLPSHLPKHRAHLPKCQHSEHPFSWDLHSPTYNPYPFSPTCYIFSYCILRISFKIFQLHDGATSICQFPNSQWFPNKVLQCCTSLPLTTLTMGSSSMVNIQHPRSVTPGVCRFVFQFALQLANTCKQHCLHSRGIAFSPALGMLQTFKNP